MSGVCLAYVCRSLVVVKIIVFLAQCQSALHKVQDVHRGILLVRAEVITVGNTKAYDGIFELKLSQGLDILGSLYLVHYRLHGSHTLGVASCGVHGELVEVAELLLHAALSEFLLCEACYDAVDALVVVFLQLVKAAEARVCGRQRVKLLPSATCKLVKVLRRTYRLV